MAVHRVIWLIFILIFTIAQANIVPNEEIDKNSIEIERLKTEMQSVVQTIVRFYFILNKKIKYRHYYDAYTIYVQLWRLMWRF